MHIKVLQQTAATCSTGLHDNYTGNVFISVCCHGAVWKQATVSSSESSLYVRVSVLPRCSLETSHCQSVHQRAACVYMSVWKQATVSHSVREQPVCAYQSVGTVQSGNKPLSVSQSESSVCVHVSVLSRCSLETSHCQSVRQRAACVCMSISCRGAVGKRATVSQSVRKQSVYACQSVAMLQSGDKPLPVSISESTLCVHVSLLSRCNLETRHSQSVSQRAPSMCLSAVFLP